MTRYLCVLACLLFLQPAYAQDKPEYSAALIPDSLKTNASSVLRQQVVETEIGGSGKASIKTKQVITVLNESGADRLVFYDHEDKFRKLDFAEVRVFDAVGNQLKRYKKKEMEKIAGGDEVSLVVDDKIYYLAIPSFSLPFTVEFNTEVSLSGFVDLDDFYTGEYERSIQSSVLSIKSGATNKLRFKNINSNVQPVVSTQKDITTWQWQVSNAKALQAERGAPENSLPRVMITPTYFEMDDYGGEMVSWQKFGEWYGKLSVGANNLSQEKSGFFRDMVKDIPDTLMKIKKLYEYLQENYRYVSIQLGIGGFKPFNASYVDKNKFGDCKALSNFMQTILAAAGIRSHQALINGGYRSNPVDPEFANNSFNHVILCVPGKKDSTWLECTSRDNPFGKLGSFTENRYALLITEDGGKIVATPGSKATDNVWNGNSRVMLEADGSGKGLVLIAHKGSMHDMFRNSLWEQPEHKQKDFLLRGQSFKDYDALAMEKQNFGDEGVTKLDMHFEKIPDFSAGPKHFLRPHLYSVWSTVPPEIKTKRVNDYLFRDPFIETDTTVWQLPEGYVMESMPTPASFSIDMASFESKYAYDDNSKTITAITRMELKKNRIPSAKYPEARLFFQRVVKELDQKIIVKRG